MTPSLVRVALHHLSLVAAVAVLGGSIAAACGSDNGSAAPCFSSAMGPAEVACTTFPVGLSCPVGLTPAYTCTCTAFGAARSWVCNATPDGGAGGGGTGGAGFGGRGAGGALATFDAGGTDAASDAATGDAGDASPDALTDAASDAAGDAG
jgi:hypothetical protein